MRSILINLLSPVLQGRKISKVLEAGCGTGFLADFLHRQYGWTVIAVDLAWEGVAMARSGTPVQANIVACPFPEGVFDAVFCLDVLVHFPPGHEGQALSELSRVIRSGGLLVVRVSALKCLRSRHSEWAHERQRFSKERLIRAVEEQGFRTIRCTYANSLLLPIAAARFRIWEPLMRKQAASGTGALPKWLNALLSIPLAGEAAMLRRVDLPIGQSLILIAERT